MESFWKWHVIPENLGFFASGFRLTLTIFALSWVGMWMGLRSSRHQRATLATLGRVMGLPWLAIFLLAFLGAGRGFSPGFIFPFWFMLGIVTDLFVGISARAKLRRDFRQLFTCSNEASIAQLVWPPAESIGSATNLATATRS